MVQTLASWARVAAPLLLLRSSARRFVPRVARRPASSLSCFPSSSSLPPRSFSSPSLCGSGVRSHPLPPLPNIAPSSNFSSSAASDRMNPEEVLQFWYKDVDPQNDVFASNLWFRGGSDFDKECAEKFGECLKLASSGALNGWMETLQGRLALVIVLDQLSRNVYRGSPSAFSQDASALKITVQTIEKGLDKALKPWERWFLYLPLMHSENLHDHEMADRVFQELADSEEASQNDALRAQLLDVVDFERKHRDVIRKYGRYPSRNAALGRSNTKEEDEYIATGGGF